VTVPPTSAADVLATTPAGAEAVINGLVLVTTAGLVVLVPARRRRRRP